MDRWRAPWALAISLILLASSCGGSTQPPAATAASAAASAAATLAATATPDDFPSKPLTFVVSTTPGSTIDLFNRTIAQLLGEKLGQNIVVENKSAGGGAEALVYLQSKAADGYTWAGWTATFSAVMAEGTVPFKDSDFTYLAQLTDATLAILALTGKYKDLNDLVSKAKVAPGKLRMGGASLSLQVGAIKFQKVSGAQFTWVPFPGGTEARRALLGRDVDVITGGATEAGRDTGIVALAVTSDQRWPTLKDVPTMKELGLNVQAGQWRGVIGKGGIPASRQDKVLNALKSVVDDPRWKDFVSKIGEQPVFISGPTFGPRVSEEIKDFKGILGK